MWTTAFYAANRLRRRLLVADDDEDLRESMVALLRADGHEVVAVANGVELLNVLEISLDPYLGTKRFDLVITDLRMPGTAGPRALARMRYGVSVPPVLFITACGDSALRQEAIQLGALGVLDKPIDFEELRAVVRRQLAKRCN
jgi:CheY-like chemotaxis protein